MDCTQTLVESDEEDDNPGEDVRQQIATLKVNGNCYPVFVGENKIGRDPETCSIAIPNMALSSQHAVIEGLDCGIFIIYDLKSRNKTRLRKVILSPGVRYELKNGDNIRFANVLCEFSVLEKPNLKSDTDSEDDDIPSTQVIDLGDDEGDNYEMQISKAKKTASHEDKGSSSKRSGSQGKAVFRQLEPIFKLPPSGNIKNLNDSLGYLNMSKDSSFNEDVDDDIFDLATQPDMMETVSTFSKQRSSVSHVDQDRSPSNQADMSELELNGPDCETSVSNAGKMILDSIPSEENSKGSESLEKYQNDEKSSSIDEDIHEIKDDALIHEEDIFSAATEDCSLKNPKGSHTEGVHLVAKEIQIGGEENKVSSVTKCLTLKTNERSIVESKVSSPLKDDETTDDVDIFTAVTESFPLKTREKNVLGVNKNDGMKDDELTDEEGIFSVATEGLPLPPREKDVTSAADDDGMTDEDDLFAAATEMFPLKTKETNVPESIVSSAVEDDEITDEEDIFAAATESFPLKTKKKGECSNSVKASNAGEDEFLSSNRNEGHLVKQVTHGSIDKGNVFELAPKDVDTKSSNQGGAFGNAAKVKEMVSEQKSLDGGGFMEDSETASVQRGKGGNRESGKKLESEPIPEHSGILPLTSMDGKEKNQNDESRDDANENLDHSIDGDDEETDLEDDSFISSVNKKQIPMQNAGVNERENGASIGSGTLRGIKKNGSIIDPDLCSDSESERGDEVQIKESDASYAIISDTDDEEEDKNCLNASTGSGSGLANEDCKLKTIKSSNNAKEIVPRKDVVNEVLNVKPTESNSDPKFCDSNKTVAPSCLVTPVHSVNTKSCEGALHSVKSAVTDMTIDITLPPSRIVLLEKGGKCIMDTHCKGFKDEKTSLPSTVSFPKESSNAKAVAIDALPSHPNYNERVKTKENEDSHLKVETCCIPGLNNSIQNSESDDSKSFIMDTPMCTRDVKKKIKSFVVEDVPCEDEDDMSSFLTQVPPEFKTPKATVRSTVAEDEDLSELATQPAPCIKDNEMPSKDNGEEDDDEDMSSFLTQAPPEFKTPRAAVRNTVAEDEDLSELATQPAPCIKDNEMPSKDNGEEDDDEDMSSFLTQAPPEFKTPRAAVRNTVAEDEDLSELATQPAPCIKDNEMPSKDNGEEDDDEDMSSFLTQAPPEFKTPRAAVRNTVAEDEDLSELATQPAPGMADCQMPNKEHGVEEDEEDMSSFLTQAPPEFKTPRAAVRNTVAEDEDLSELATQPAPGMADCQMPNKEHGVEEDEEDMSSFLTQAPPEFKTPTAAVKGIVTEDEDLSELATQPAPGMADCHMPSKEYGEDDDDDMSSFLTQAPPEFKTPREALKTVIKGEKEGLCEFRKQSDLVLENNVAEEKALTKKGKSETYDSEDHLSLLDTQPAPSPSISYNVKRKCDKYSTSQVKEQKQNKTKGGLKKNCKDVAQRDVLTPGSELLSNRTPQGRSSRARMYSKKEEEPQKMDTPLSGEDGVGSVLISSSKINTDDSDGSDGDLSFLLPDTPDIIRETRKEGVSNQLGSCRNLFLTEKLETFPPISKATSSETNLLSLGNRQTRSLRNPSLKKKELLDHGSARVSKAKRSDLKKGMISETKQQDLEGPIAVKERMKIIGPSSKSNIKEYSLKGQKVSTEVQKKNLMPPKCGISAFNTKTSLNLNDKLITSTPVPSSFGLSEGSSELGKMSCNANSYRRRNAESVLGSTINSESICEIPEDTSPEMENVSSNKRFSKNKHLRKGNQYRSGETLNEKDISAILSIEDSGKESKLRPPVARVKESAPEAKNTRSVAEHGRKRNLLTSSVEAAPAGRVLTRLRKEENESSDESAIASKQPKRHETKTKRPSVERTASNRRGSAVKVMDSANEEGSHSESISVDKIKDKLQGSMLESDKDVDSTYIASRKGKQSDSVEVPFATIRSTSSLKSAKENFDVVRRSERGRKPKRRFSVDISPVKPKKAKAVCETMETVPPRLLRGRKSKKELNPLSGIQTNSSQESAFSSDSEVSNKRKNENSRNESDSKRFKHSAEEGSSEKKPNDEESKNERRQRGRQQSKGSASTVDAVSEDKPKVIETRLSGLSVQGMPPSVAASISGSENKPMAVNAATVGRRRKGKIQRDAQLAIPEDKSKVDHEKQNAMLGVIVPSGLISKVENVEGLGIKRRGWSKKEPVAHSKKTPESVNTRITIEDPHVPELDTTSSLVKPSGNMKDSPTESEVSVKRKGTARINKGNTSGKATEANQRTSGRTRKKESVDVIDSTENSSTTKRTSRKTGSKESTNTVDSIGNYGSKSTTVDGEGPEKSKVTTGGDEVKTGILENWRRISPSFKKSVENEKPSKTAPNSSMSVPPLRFSRVKGGSDTKRHSGPVVVNSPLRNESTITKSVCEDKSLRVRNQKKNSYNVLFTGLSDPKLNQIVKNLGGSVVDTIQNCSVLVTDRLRRTYKLLCAIACGIPIVTVQWLMQSSSNGRFLEPNDFLVSDKATEKRFDFTLKTSLEKAKAKPIFSGLSFIATPNVKPPPAEVQGIVTCAGGEYVSTTKAFESKDRQLSYVVSCLDDATTWDQYTVCGLKKRLRGRPSRRKANMSEEPIQTKLVGVEGLLVSVLRQKIDLENKEFCLN